MINNRNILIVDDVLSARETLKGHLTGQDYNLVFANDAIEAFKKIVENPPDVILLDVMMPGMDGFELCRHLKSDEKWRHIPVILVTALDNTDDLVRGLDAGADDFLAKPVNGSELRARVRSMLRIKYQYDTLNKQQQELEASLYLNQNFSQAIVQHLEALEVVHDAGLRSIKHNLNLDSVLSLISQTALDLIPEGRGCIIYFLADDGQLLPVVFPSKADAKLVYPSLGIEGLVNQAIETGLTLDIISDVTAAPHQLQPQLSEICALLVVPLNDGQRVLGALCLYSAESDVFEANHCYILATLAKQAAITITKARFFEERTRAKEREKQVIRNMFQRYVSPTVVERLVDGRETLTLGGERQEITVLFSDIRGFSTFSDGLPPEDLVKVLNQYLALAVEAVLAQEATLDKFMGDAVMAFFNAPLPQSDHTLRAVRSALAMQQAIASYNANVVSHRQLSFGIGIHVGHAVVGNIGTAQQMNYTAIGDTVNLAKRLQEKAQGGQIILSQAVYEAVKDIVTVEDLGIITVKGRSTAEHVYSLITGLSESKPVISEYKELK